VDREDFKFMRWLESLSEEQKQELGSIDYPSGLVPSVRDQGSYREIAADWIEEHGGKRSWWWAILTEIVEEDK